MENHNNNNFNGKLISKDKFQKELDEENVINEFILHLYHKNFLNINENTYNISKEMFRSTLKKYCEDKCLINLDSNLDDILLKCKLITKNSSSQDLVTINSKNLLRYENFVLYEKDIKKVNETLLKQIKLKDDVKIDFRLKKDKLEFRTCVLTKENLLVDESKNNTCQICLLNFLCNESFEDHLETHNSTSNFEWIDKNNGSPFSRFQIFYQTSEDSNFLKFTLNTDYSGISFKEIVTVRSKDIPVLVNHNNQEIPIDEGGSFEFVVDKHIFIKSIEQPIYVIFSMLVNEEENLRERFVELHLVRPIILLPVRNLSGNIMKKSELKAKKGSLKEHYPRDSLKELYASGQIFSENDLFNINENFRKFCEEDKKILTPSNISDILIFLLEMQDIETERFYRNFTQTQATVKCIRTSSRDFEYSIKLDNLRDDILFQNQITGGDEIILILNNDFGILPANQIFNMTNEPSNPIKKMKSKFFCIISNIYGTTIFFQSRGKDKIDISKKYDVEFRPNRRNFMYQYAALKAIDEYSLLSLFLFPEDKPFKQPASLDLHIIDDNVRNNPEQKEAVMNIVDGVKDFLPYIIVGPPGTGKTTTIVECIMQLQIKKPESRILVTAGSNAACNEIAKRLIKTINSNLPHIKMLRLYSKSAEKSYEHINEMLIDASNLMYGNHFYPSLETINGYNIVICTISLIGRLKSAGLNPTSYSHCFIDECAASTEPEALLAIEAIFHTDINVIITGDPKQLGPILQSNRAAEYGLKYSLLDRLLNRECYRVNSDKTFNRKIQTRLIRNFRTHSDILTISNRLFYSNDLLACASEDITHWATECCFLPQNNLPLIFHCVNGYTKKDKYSTSLFNPKEANIVMDYVKRLMYFHLNGREIKEEDIGIISPYKKQNVIIREELDRRNWYKIGTGSVETFQGQEKPIIIISTVRSILSDKSGVGFLTNEKRLNVMLTRAQALLIIIGSTECLLSVPNWKETIEYCQEKNVVIRNEDMHESVEDIDVFNLAHSLDFVKINS